MSGTIDWNIRPGDAVSIGAAVAATVNDYIVEHDSSDRYFKLSFFGVGAGASVGIKLKNENLETLAKAISAPSASKKSFPSFGSPIYEGNNTEQKIGDKNTNEWLSGPALVIEGGATGAVAGAGVQYIFFNIPLIGITLPGPMMLDAMRATLTSSPYRGVCCTHFATVGGIGASLGLQVGLTMYSGWMKVMTKQMGDP